MCRHLRQTLATWSSTITTIINRNNWTQIKHWTRRQRQIINKMAALINQSSSKISKIIWVKTSCFWPPTIIFLSAGAVNSKSIRFGNLSQKCRLFRMRKNTYKIQSINKEITYKWSTARFFKQPGRSKAARKKADSRLRTPPPSGIISKVASTSWHLRRISSLVLVTKGCMEVMLSPQLRTYSAFKLQMTSRLTTHRKRWSTLRRSS